MIAKGLEKDKETRWQTAAEYRDALIAASREFGQTAPHRLGNFVRRLFPEVEQQAQRLERFGRNRFSVEHPEGDLALKTRTGYMSSSDVKALENAPDNDEPVSPVDLVPPSEEETRTRLTKVYEPGMLQDMQASAAAGWGFDSNRPQAAPREASRPPALGMGSKTRAYESDSAAEGTPVRVRERGKSGLTENVPREPKSPANPAAKAVAKVETQKPHKDPRLEAAQRRAMIDDVPQTPHDPDGPLAQAQAAARNVSQPRGMDSGGYGGVPQLPPPGALPPIPVMPTDPSLSMHHRQMPGMQHPQQPSGSNQKNWLMGIGLVIIGVGILLQAAMSFIRWQDERHAEDRRRPPRPQYEEVYEDYEGEPEGVTAEPGEPQDTIRPKKIRRRRPVRKRRMRRPAKDRAPTLEPALVQPAPDPLAKKIRRLEGLLRELERAEASGTEVLKHKHGATLELFLGEAKKARDLAPKSARPKIARALDAADREVRFNSLTAATLKKTLKALYVARDAQVE